MRYTVYAASPVLRNVNCAAPPTPAALPVIATSKLPTAVMPVPTAIVITPDEVPKLMTVKSNVLLTFALVNAASIKAAVGQVYVAAEVDGLPTKIPPVVCATVRVAVAVAVWGAA